MLGDLLQGKPSKLVRRLCTPFRRLCKHSSASHPEETKPGVGPAEAICIQVRLDLCKGVHLCCIAQSPTQLCQASICCRHNCLVHSTFLPAHLTAGLMAHRIPCSLATNSYRSPELACKAALFTVRSCQFVTVTLCIFAMCNAVLTRRGCFVSR